MEIYYSSLPATLKTVMAKNKEKMDHNVSSCCNRVKKYSGPNVVSLPSVQISGTGVAMYVARGGWLL